MMSSTADSDPFDQVKADVESTLSQLRPLFASYLRIRSLATSKTSTELAQAKQELETMLEELNQDVQDMTESVRAVQADHYRYGLEIEEVERRRRFVQEVAGELEDVREEMGKPFVTLSQGGSNNGDHRGQQSVVSGLRSPSEFDMMSPGSANTDYVAIDEHMRQQELMHEQDQQLDQVEYTVRSIREQAGMMTEELESQHQLLEEVNDLTDRVGGKLKNGLKRVQWVMRNNEDTWSSCFIGVLIIVLIVLLVLALAA